MENDLMQNILNMQKAETITELKECNSFTVSYGLSLSDTQIMELAGRRFEALKNTGRVEFKQGILKKLILEFCDSPFIFQENYEATISELQESFYYFKNESQDRLSDDELITLMKKYFDGRCQGSLDYLSGTSLEELCRGTRYGYESDEDSLF